jgi:hypothetical protein
VKLILNEELPRDLRRSLEQDAREVDQTMNDRAVSVLASRFGVEYVPGRGRFSKVVAQFKLRVPDDLHRAIRVQAAYLQQTVRGVALAALADHYEAKPIDPHRRRRT